jgi:hypothetical protein
MATLPSMNTRLTKHSRFIDDILPLIVSNPLLLPVDVRNSIISKYLVCATGVNVDNHEGALMSSAVRLGRVFVHWEEFVPKGQILFLISFIFRRMREYGTSAEEEECSDSDLRQCRDLGFYGTVRSVYYGQ